ncbi:hypothetical protein [Roseovarius indicus]|uniref:Uncharacterized protein n=1 Tax=Roseovarius indicus TaxID=540747 RepID=A0A0T5PAB5_9RHOB|nr:hypothetical protein [Roseovarius indicus]KRS18233.1 hypothetical protein XM52_08780 [Roseovarius indicus]QEW26934.1 hypothetical protein RIdsm_02742 [Roseovarius indicus]SFD57514.1 hypothetical protein SAMN04488031_101602 [Roseovarius indicus]
MSNPNTHPEYSRARSLIDQALNEISEDGDIGEFANCLLGQSCALYRLVHGDSDANGLTAMLARIAAREAERAAQDPSSPHCGPAGRA